MRWAWELLGGVACLLFATFAPAVLTVPPIFGALIFGVGLGSIYQGIQSYRRRPGRGKGGAA